jgi:hypothetical protein
MDRERVFDVLLKFNMCSVCDCKHVSVNVILARRFITNRTECYYFKVSGTGRTEAWFLMQSNNEVRGGGRVSIVWKMHARKKKISLVQGWQTFLREGAQIVYNFRQNYFACLWEFWAEKLGLGDLHPHYSLLYFSSYIFLLL